jgi:hypothetical protein
MKTRTLLLLALACGVMIMVAGAVFLFQLAGQDEVAPATAVGESVEVGDMTVTVVGEVEVDGVLTVEVSIGGVDDDDGVESFRLIASGRALTPLPATEDTDCDATTVAARSCTVRFDVSDADGSSRVLFYDRGDDGARWVLA